MMRDVEQQSDGGAKVEELSAYAYEKFMKVFSGLCRNEAEKEDLSRLFRGIYQRWGYHGCDMVSAFPDKYRNLDFDRLKRAGYVFINSSSGDMQFAAEEFWWLMGVGKECDLLEDTSRFEEFSRMAAERGLEACKVREDQIRNMIKTAVEEKK